MNLPQVLIQMVLRFEPILTCTFTHPKPGCVISSWRMVTLMPLKIGSSSV
jgi:hypothetical protein